MRQWFLSSVNFARLLCDARNCGEHFDPGYFTIAPCAVVHGLQLRDGCHFQHLVNERCCRQISLTLSVGFCYKMMEMTGASGQWICKFTSNPSVACNEWVFLLREIACDEWVFFMREIACASRQRGPRQAGDGGTPSLLRKKRAAFGSNLAYV